MRPSMRILRTLVLVVSLAVASPLPVAEGRPGLPTLAGSNLVAASHSGWMAVHLTRPVRISTAPFDNPLITISKGGPLAAVILRQDVARGVEVVMTRADLCRRGCSGEAFSVLQVFEPKAERFHRRVTLPAGRYQLYVSAVGGPTRARIELPGLAGRARFRPQIDAAERSRAVTADNPNAFSAEVQHRLSARGISLLALEVDTEYFAGTNLSSCIEPSDGEVPEAADGPTCEGGRTAGSGAVVSHTLEGGRKIVISMGQLGPGAWQHQLSFRSAAVIRSLHARELELTYDSSDRSDEWLYTLSFSL